MRPLSPRVPPYIAPRMPTLASAPVAPAPAATMPAYRSAERAASAIAASPLMPASTRGSSCATSATTNRQPSSATAAGRICSGTDSAPPPFDAHRPVTTPPGVGLVPAQQGLVGERRAAQHGVAQPQVGAAFDPDPGVQQLRVPARRV